MQNWKKLIAVSLLSFSSWAAATTPGQQAAAEQLLNLVRANQLTVPVYMQVREAFEQRYADAGVTGREALLERYQAQANAILEREIGWSVLQPQIVALYTAAFNQQELEQLVAFYRSPLGAKVLQQLPMLTAESAQLTQAQVFKAAPEINRLLEQMSKELGAKP